MKSPTVHQTVTSALSNMLGTADTRQNYSNDTEATPMRYTMQQVLQWNEEKVCRWVCEQGFSKYESTFRENMITGEALVELDYTLLKELSVRTVGERVRLNLAIRRLRQQCLQVDGEEPPQSSSTLTASSRPKRSATLEYSNIRDSLAMHMSPASTAMSGATATGESSADHTPRMQQGSKDPPKLPRVSLSSNSISMASAATTAGVAPSIATGGSSVPASNGSNGNTKSPNSASSIASSGNTNGSNNILQRANTDVRAFTGHDHKISSHNTPMLGTITQRMASHNTSAPKAVQPLQPLKSTSQQSASFLSSDVAAATSVPKHSNLSLKPIASHQHTMQGIEPMSAPLPRLRMLTSSAQKQNKRSPPSVQPLQLLKDAAESRGLKAAQNDEIERLGLQFQEFFGTDISVTRLADSLSVRTWNVTITGPENEMRQVSIANSSSAQAILSRVRREFDLKNDADSDQYSLFSMTSAAGGARCLSNEELEHMFADPTRAPPEKFFLRKRHQLSRPPIGTKRSEHLQRAIEKLGNIIPGSSSSTAQQQQLLQLQSSHGNPQLQRPESKWDNTSERLSQVLGERPPSELVSMNVEKYFPGNEARARHSIMRRRRQGSHDNEASLDSTDSPSARQSRRQSRAHRRSTSTSTSSVSASRIMQAARLQSATINNSNRWSVLTSGLEPIKEVANQSPSFLNASSAKDKRVALPDGSDPAASIKASDSNDDDTGGVVRIDTRKPTATAVDVESDDQDKVTPRKNKRMSRIYTNVAVETMHSISSESLQLSDDDSNMSDRDDDSAGSLSDLSSSHLSDSFDSDDDSFYDSLDDSDIDADEDLAADDESEMHASTSAVGSASVASAVYVQGSDQSTAVLNAASSSAQPATGAEPKGANEAAGDPNKVVSRSASGTSRSGRVHSSSGGGGGGGKKKVWIKGAPIASGSFGSVYFGMNTRTGAIMAVKEVELPTPGSVSNNRNQRMVDALKHELDLLKGLDHKNVVKYLGTDVDDTNLYIFLEYVSGGSVSSALASFGMFPESLVRTYTAQILEGLVYLHEQGIIHRDIKGGNVLIDQDGSVKISDFGISKRVDEAVAAGKKARRASLQGSVFWMAPEVVKDTHYTFKGDVWSLGCLVIEMMTGTHPFPDLDQLQALYSIGQRGRPKTPDGISSDGIDFLDQTLQVDVDQRPTATDLMAHIFVCDIAPPSP
ncbi:ATP binding [Coemansia sp. RSA 1933]|nr:ATP binding [Coemansia sp. RSA 1933]